jgi:hypothetical protein
LVASAIAGNARAQALLLSALARNSESDEPADAGSLSAEDRELLEIHSGNKWETRREFGVDKGPAALGSLVFCSKGIARP